MKKIIAFLLAICMICLLVACGNNPSPTQSTTTEPPQQDVIEIIDGYIWVNGVNTGIKAEECDHNGSKNLLLYRYYFGCGNNGKYPQYVSDCRRSGKARVFQRFLTYFNDRICNGRL